MNDEHIPAPAEHSPRKKTLQVDSHEFIVYEKDNHAAWVGSDYTVEVKR
jgi:hypothetical protein